MFHPCIFAFVLAKHRKQSRFGSSYNLGYYLFSSTLTTYCLVTVLLSFVTWLKRHYSLLRTKLTFHQMNFFQNASISDAELQMCTVAWLADFEFALSFLYFFPVLLYVCLHKSHTSFSLGSKIRGFYWGCTACKNRAAIFGARIKISCFFLNSSK